MGSPRGRRMLVGPPLLVGQHPVTSRRRAGDRLVAFVEKHVLHTVGARTVPIADAMLIADGPACGEGLELAVAVDVEEATAFDVAAGASASHGARSCPNSSLSSTLVASAAQFTRALSVRVE